MNVSQYHPSVTLSNPSEHVPTQKEIVTLLEFPNSLFHNLDISNKELDSYKKASRDCVPDFIESLPCTTAGVLNNKVCIKFSGTKTIELCMERLVSGSVLERVMDLCQVQDIQNGVDCGSYKTFFATPKTPQSWPDWEWATVSVLPESSIDFLNPWSSNAWRMAGTNSCTMKAWRSPCSGGLGYAVQ